MWYNELMKKAIAMLFVAVFAVAGYAYLTQENNPLSPKGSSLTGPGAQNSIQPSEKKTFLFVPYWTFENNVESDEFDSLLYFGISVNEKGIDTEDPGYKKIGQFMEATDSRKERILVVRMVDATVNSEIIKNTSVQTKIITDSISLAKEHGYDGVLLDFETSAFGFENTIKNISNFYTRYSESVHDENLLFYTSLFGDTYYRARAYDISLIGKVSDKVLVMTYDFHKSRGNPGPNFPLQEREKYGYDLEKMVEDYQKDIKNEKLIIVLGYFGYDWEISDNKDEALSNGVPLSTNKITQDFIHSCIYTECIMIRNKSKEPSIKYVTKEENHVVWFEDEISVGEKIKELKKMRVNQTGVWAYSYY